MTRDEAEAYAKEMTYRDAVYNALQGKCIPYRKATLIKLYELLDVIESQESDDAISRQAVIELIEGWWLGHTKEDHLSTEIKSLPSVSSVINPYTCPYYEPDEMYDPETEEEYDWGHCVYKPFEQKKGRWIEVTDEETLTTRTYHYECSECGSHLKAVEKTRYCSECGALLLVDAKMQEE